MSRPRIAVGVDTLHVNGRTWRFADLKGAAAEQRSNFALWPAVVGGIAGVGALPVLIALLGTESPSVSENLLYVGLFVAALALFGSIARLLFVEDRYCLMLDTDSGGSECALACDDPQLVISLVAEVNERVRRLQNVYLLRPDAPPAAATATSVRAPE